MKTNDGASSEEGRTAKAGASRRTPPRMRDVTASPDGGSLSISADERRRLIAEAAYYRAEARGFAPGSETDDWLAAEAEIDDNLIHR